MIWDYFRFTDLKHIVINSLYLAECISLMMRKEKSAFFTVILYVILLMINPVSILVVKKFLAGVFSIVCMKLG